MTPTTPPSQAAGAELTRQALQGSPWQFVLAYEPQIPLIVPAVADEVRVLVAHCLGRLGLRTPALEHLRLGPAAAARRGIPEAIRNVERLPSDLISQPDRIETCRRNLDAIAVRDGLPGDLEAKFDRWASQIDQTQAFRTTPRIPVLRRRLDQHWAWTHFNDQSLLASCIAPEQVSPGPLYVDGLHAPLGVRRLLELTPQTPLGLVSELTLLASDDAELFDSLSIFDYRDVLCLDRVRLLVGPDVLSKFRTRFIDDLDRSMGLLVSIPGGAPTPGRFSKEALAAVLQEVRSTQIDRGRRVAAELEAEYAPRDLAWWQRRFAIGADDAPLRVLIPTTRFSSFLKHSAADMADALKALGHDARVYSEPDDRTQFGTLGFSRAIAAYQPDLVVLINATRTHYEGAIPPNLPVVTWVQDAMPRLFDQKIGSAMGPLDFLAGHLHLEFFEKFGYPARRMVQTPVVASPRKFSTNPAPRELLDKYACEIAYVSHHGEPPEACRDRLIAEASGSENAWLVPVIERTFDAICALATQKLTGTPVDAGLRELVLNASREVLGREPDDVQLVLAHHSAARPIAERANRHQMVSWAVDICRKRNWRLHLYGRGWDRLEHFAPFAKGNLDHAEELRAAYQAASVHLHGGLTTFLHQRVMECALSGGLPLVRFVRDDFDLIVYHTAMRLTVDGLQPYVSTVDYKVPYLNCMDDPDAVKLARLRQFNGIFPLMCAPLYAHWVLGEQNEHRRQMVHPRDAIWLLGDHTQTTFDSPEGLESLAEKAVQSPRLRESLSRGIRERVTRTLTYDAVFQRIFSMIRRELSAPAAMDAPVEPKQVPTLEAA